MTVQNGDKPQAPIFTKCRIKKHGAVPHIADPELMNSIDTKVYSHPPTLQTLLELRYLCFNTWEEISVALHLDIRWVHRLHNKALSEIDAIRRAES